MLPRFSENFDQKIRGPVDHFGLIFKIFGAIDHAQKFDHPFHLIQVPQSGLHRCQTIDPPADGAALPGHRRRRRPALPLLHVRHHRPPQGGGAHPPELGLRVESPRVLQSQMSGADRVLLPFPLAFTGGLSVAMTTMWCGATLVLEPAFAASRALDLIEQQRISVFMAVPLIYQQMADLPRFAAADLSSLRIASTGGAAVPPALLRTYLDRDVIVVQTYALTEATAGGTTLPSHDGLRKLGSAGLPAMHSELRVVRDDGEPCAVREVGEIAIRGPEVMVGYWSNPEATAAALVDGWLRTGDLGYLDEEGYLFVVDRAKDMLISGGLNVYPAEIEKLLAALPGVTELAVIGVPDREWGETPAVIAVGDDVVTPASVLDGLPGCARRLQDAALPGRSHRAAATQHVGQGAQGRAAHGLPRPAIDGDSHPLIANQITDRRARRAPRRTGRALAAHGRDPRPTR